TENGNVLSSVSLAAGLKESSHAFRDFLLRYRGESIRIVVEAGKIDLHGIGTVRVPRSYRFDDLREWHLDHVSADPGFQNENVRLPIGSESREVTDAFFMVPFVCFERSPAVFLGMVVN